MKKDNTLLSVVGPTATGKSKLAVEIAKKFNGEIINADSMQVYKELNIGTSKPTVCEMDNIPHHLLGIISCNENFDLSKYVNLAKEKIKIITEKNKLPILVGGTGLYIDSVINNVNLNLVPKNLELRSKLLNQAKERGVNYLIEKLTKIDKEAMLKIGENDLKRIIRALEINYITGENVSVVYEKSKDVSSIYNNIIIGLNYLDRNLLYKKIDDRVDSMISLGLVEEAKALFDKGLSHTAFQAIGYKEFVDYFENRDNLQNVIQKIKQNSRKYAKRQLTWFRKNNNIIWINIDDCENFEDIKNYCLKLLEKLLKK